MWVLAYDDSFDAGLPGLNEAPDAWRSRQDLTIELASEFIREHRANDCPCKPIGVAQGWSPDSYARAVRLLQNMGYDYIALGGVVPLKSTQILEVLRRVSDVRVPGTALHLLGVTRLEHAHAFRRYGVMSFDSTSPLRRAFKDKTDNYYTLTGSYTAVRVPQVDANPRLQRRIGSGEVRQEEARRLERECLDRLRAYDQGECDVSVPLAVLEKYEVLCSGSAQRNTLYAEVLEARPWEKCGCSICSALGIEVILFRGAERNRRRGFHNLHVFYRRLVNEVTSRLERSN